MARLTLKRQRVQAVLSGVSALVTKRSADIQGFALNRRTSGRLDMDRLRGGLRNVTRLYSGTTVLVRVTAAENCTRRRFAIAEGDGVLNGDDSEVKRSPMRVSSRLHRCVGLTTCLGRLSMTR